MTHMTHTILLTVPEMIHQIGATAKMQNSFRAKVGKKFDKIVLDVEQTTSCNASTKEHKVLKATKLKESDIPKNESAKLAEND